MKVAFKNVNIYLFGCFGEHLPVSFFHCSSAAFPEADVEREGNNSQRYSESWMRNGSSQGQNLALTVLFVTTLESCLDCLIRAPRPESSLDCLFRADDADVLDPGEGKG